MNLKAVTVTAGSFEAGDNKRAATVLNSIDIATTAGSNADITAALKTLPGAQQVGNQKVCLFVAEQAKKPNNLLMARF